MKVLIAGGGTGGHLFPAIALAEAFLERDPANRVQFVSTRRAVDREVLAAKGFPALTIEAAGVKGKGIFSQMRSLLTLPKALKQSLAIIRGFQPQLVIGVGGYISGPVVLAAWLKGLPTAVQEQNAIPGLTNRLLGRVADRIFLAFERGRDFFPPSKCRLTGNPVRQELRQAQGTPGEPGGPLHILILGGSQGAHRINRLLIESLEFLAPLKRNLFFIHQTGTKDEDWVRQAYRNLGFEHQVAAFIHDMARAYSRAHMLVCRAGAMTLAEITALGKASILIPFPFAANNHQEENARTLVQAGAAEMYREADLTAEVLGERLVFWAENPGHRERLAAQARLLGRWQAAQE
ncbi:MAG: undecaprenyldiphospho-muramoylpentapeptide beta-N-acetylglucosaminyltransferase, partial [Desulfobacterota bacterium]|nr:undecaprenyldiphospho-muramoylpentapeptide beta-N-acetylglucosaminyltransferase [Thermodesulfobacteriota bacterium]